VGPRDVLGAARGSLGTPWGSLVGLGVSLEDSLGGPGASLGSPCRGPSAPNATHSDVSAFGVLGCSGVCFLCFFRFCCRLFVVFVFLIC